MSLTAAGDREAFAELIRRHQQKVMALAVRTLGSEDLAADVAQDVFLRVFESTGRYKPRARFTTWLYRIVVNRCLDVLRRRGRAAIPLEGIERAGRTSDVAGQAERAELAEKVRRAVAELPPRQRMAVILHRYHELSHREVAAVTGWSSSAVESLLVRAYAALREALADLREGG